MRKDRNCTRQKNHKHKKIFTTHKSQKPTSQSLCSGVDNVKGSLKFPNIAKLIDFKKNKISDSECKDNISPKVENTFVRNLFSSVFPLGGGGGGRSSFLATIFSSCSCFALGGRAGRGREGEARGEVVRGGREGGVGGAEGLRERGEGEGEGWGWGSSCGGGVYLKLNLVVVIVIIAKNNCSYQYINHHIKS